VDEQARAEGAHTGGEVGVPLQDLEEHQGFLGDAGWHPAAQLAFGFGVIGRRDAVDALLHAFRLLRF
jgi:hypothetical protein